MSGHRCAAPASVGRQADAPRMVAARKRTSQEAIGFALDRQWHIARSHPRDLPGRSQAGRLWRRGSSSEPGWAYRTESSRPHSWAAPRPRRWWSRSGASAAAPVPSLRPRGRTRGVWAYEDEVLDRAAILPTPGFRGVRPRRWVGERTVAWLRHNGTSARTSSASTAPVRR